MVTKPTSVILPLSETAQFRKTMVEINEALLISSVRQHELTEEAERLNAKLRGEIAARQKIARELAEKARLIDLSNDAIIVRDAAGRILLWNRGAEELYGWAREEALGKISNALLQTEYSTPLEQITAELHRNDRWTGELTHTKRDGQRITVLVRKALDRDTEGNPAAVLQTITDITERKRAEQSLSAAKDEISRHAIELEETVAKRTAELRATIGELEAFSYSISHDMRAPLRAMRGFADILMEKHSAQLDTEGINHLQKIHAAAGRMDNLIQDVLTYTRVLRAEVKIEPVDLDVLVRQVIGIYPELQTGEAEIQIEGVLPKVLGGEASLAQCVSNLLTNAVKFVAPGIKPRVKIRTEAIAADVRLWVEDNGIGIAPKDQARIFKMFERVDGDTTYQGTGMGLTIVRKAVERMGGQTGVESEAGQGSKFWIQLKGGNS